MRIVYIYIIKTLVIVQMFDFIVKEIAKVQILFSARTSKNCLHVLGCNVDIPEYPFDSQYDDFTFNSLLTREESISAIGMVRSECNKVVIMSLFHIPTTKPMRLEEFEQTQAQATSQVNQITGGSSLTCICWLQCIFVNKNSLWFFTCNLYTSTTFHNSFQSQSCRRALTPSCRYWLHDFIIPIYNNNLIKGLTSHLPSFRGF